MRAAIQKAVISLRCSPTAFAVKPASHCAAMDRTARERWRDAAGGRAGTATRAALPASQASDPEETADERGPPPLRLGATVPGVAPVTAVWLFRR